MDIPFTTTPQYGSVVCDAYLAPADVPQGATYTDPAFGGVSTALTSPLQNAWTHRYSIPSPIDAANRYVSVSTPGGGFAAVDLSTPNLDAISMAAQGSWPSPLWDPNVEGKFYFFNDARDAVMAHTLSTQQTVTVKSFAGAYSDLTNGGSSRVSGDGWMALFTETEHAVCALDTGTGKAYCADYLQPKAVAHVGYDFLDYVLVTTVDKDTKKRYVILWANPTPAIFSVNMNTGVLDFESRGPELVKADGFIGRGNNDGICDTVESCLGAPHGDLTTMDGVPYFVLIMQLTGDKCQTDLVMLRISDLEAMVTNRHFLATVGHCSSAFEWPDSHISGSDKTGMCVISTYTDHPAPFGNQILLLRDKTRITRLAFSNSKKVGCDTYWAFPRAAISPDGSMIVYDSNWNRSEAGCTGTSFEQVFSMPVPK